MCKRLSAATIEASAGCVRETPLIRTGCIRETAHINMKPVRDVRGTSQIKMGTQNEVVVS